MAEICRDLGLAVFSWILGILAVQFYPVLPSFTPHTFTDYLTLALFEPYEMLLTGLCLSLSSYVLCILLTRHGKQLIHRGFGTAYDMLLHVITVLFTLYILLIQIEKFPSFTVLFLGLAGLAQLRQMVKNLTLRVKK